jgi:PKD repeat protein
MKKKLLYLMTMVFCALSFIVQAQDPCSIEANFDFKADKCTLSFSDLSVAGPGDTITNWQWNFGDGTTSFLQNPTHVYATSGTYTVCLTAVDGPAICQDKICIPVTVEGCGQVDPCGVKPIFKFKVDKCTAYFTDFSGTNAGTTITNWYWNFGDGTTSTLQNPIHTYTTPGTYTVCLITVAINTAGQQCKNEYCFPVKVASCGIKPFCKLAAKFDFKVDKCKVSFADLSAAGIGTTITSWYWDFGDATTSTLQNPIHAYATPGTYNVCLVIVGTNGAGKQCKDKFCQKITVDGCGQVEPCKLASKFDFKVDKCQVSFADLSAAGLGTTITSWHWDFGDATTSTLQNPTHVYAANGTYTVCLKIVGNNGVVKCKDQVCVKVVVEGCGQTEPCRLAAKFNFKTDKCTVGFADLSAAGPGTTITNWYWDFGDSTTSTLQNPTHTYATAGTYTVCLVIVGNDGTIKCKDQFCQQITVDGCGQVEPCKLAANFSFKTYKCDLWLTNFSTAGPGTTITSYHWDFGDSTTSTLPNPIHTYATDGTYNVCLTIVGTNAKGEQCKDQYCMKIAVIGCGEVGPCKLAAKFDFKTDKCKVGFADLSAVGVGTTITNWYWDFGDSTTSTLQNPTHNYATAGTYNVCLTIVGTNVKGEQCKDQFCMKVTVDGCGQVEPCKLAPNFSFKVDKCNVWFTDLSTAGVGTTITNWYWSFGDATTSNLQNPTHVYATAGIYNVCLTIVGTTATGEMCKEQFCQQLTIEGCGEPEPCRVASKFAFKTDKCNVWFTDLSSVGIGTIITNWYWDFGDATTSGVQNPTHTYATAGTYNVCLTIVGTTASGEQCKDQFCMMVTVDGCGQVEPCKLAAKFGFKTDKCNVWFTDLSATGLGTTITNWYWSFGDATTSTLQNPTHAYATSGTYTVCLIIVGTNANGEQCKDKFCDTVTVDGCGQVEPCKLAAKFDFKADRCTVAFGDFSVTGVGTTITNWYWDFGDSNTSTLQNPIHTYATAGTYNVCLTIVGTNAKGEQCKDQFCLKVTVDGCGQIEPCKLAAKYTYKLGRCETMFADISTVGVGTTITNYYWDFGDGDTSTLKKPTHVFAANGTYTVCLTVIAQNAKGEQCKDQYCTQLIVRDCDQNNPCQVYAKFDYKIDGCNVYFTDYSGTGVGTTINNWFWDFGDGNTSTLQNPSHVYAAAGTYEVCLVVVGENATGVKCENKLCLKIVVTDCGQTSDCKVYPKFDFKIDSCKVSFFDYSATAPGTTITDWFWNFGDGNTSTLQNPTHVYTAPGTYTVCLLVTGVNAAGLKCENKVCLVVSVNDCPKGGITTDKANVSLLSIYPNPATDIVNIGFRVKAAGQLNITVTDVQGRVVAVVKDGYYNLGNHNVVWNVNVHAGLYLITIKTADGTDQKQLLIQQ